MRVDLSTIRRISDIGGFGSSQSSSFTALHISRSVPNLYELVLKKEADSKSLCHSAYQGHTKLHEYRIVHFLRWGTKPRALDSTSKSLTHCTSMEWSEL